MPNSDFYKHFRADMQKAGVEEFKVDGLSPIPNEKVRGYQSLVTLMQQGHGYSGQFLEDTADDVRKAEESHFAKGNMESVWALRDDFSGKDRGWFANDPLDGVLGIMSEDPKTSTEYLDPAHNDNLKYLLHGRDWATVVDHYATPPGGTTTGLPVMAEDGDVRKGFGAALEAATTGEAPGAYHAVGQHSEPQARILQDTINTLYSDKAADHLPKNLSTPLAHVLTSYTPDTHEIYAASDSKYDIDWDSTGEVWSDKDGAHMAVGHQRLAAVMRGIAEDGEPSATSTGLSSSIRTMSWRISPRTPATRRSRTASSSPRAPWAPMTASGRTSSSTNGSTRRSGPPTSTTGSARVSAQH